MRNLYLLLALTLCFVSGFAQDTTGLRWITSGTYPAKITYFSNDTLDMAALTADIDVYENSTTHAIFENPNDGLLYVVADPDNLTSRDLYTVNPLSGEFVFYDSLGMVPASAEITNDGRLFLISGNADSIPGSIYEYSFSDSSLTWVAESGVTDGMVRSIGYNPNDSSLYVFSGYGDTIYRMKVDTWVEDTLFAPIVGEIHGSMYAKGKFYTVGYFDTLATYDPTTGIVDTLGIGDSSYNYMDIAEISLLEGGKTSYVLCGDSDTVIFRSKYTSASYAWYKDGAAISGATDDSLVVTESGDYRCLLQIGTGSKFIWSETMEVQTGTIPGVTLMASDSALCPGDTITINGAFGGSRQWYLNGVAIPGATGTNYDATVAGSYNQMKTNMSGCSDTADAPFVIIDADSADCSVGVFDPAQMLHFEIYPNPAANRVYLSGPVPGDKIVVLDTRGRMLLEATAKGTEIQLDLTSIPSGLYFVKISRGPGVTGTRKLLKH